MFFLRAKPWVIFTLLIIVPITGFILMALIAKAIGLNGLIPLGTAIGVYTLSGHKHWLVLEC